MLELEKINNVIEEALHGWSDINPHVYVEEDESYYYLYGDEDYIGAFSKSIATDSESLISLICDAIFAYYDVTFI